MTLTSPQTFTHLAVDDLKAAAHYTEARYVVRPTAHTC